MKTMAPCMQCLIEHGPEAVLLGLGMADYYDDGVAHMVCPNGHKSAVVLQSHKFEALLESGANALIDGYTLEAASSFAAAYERFLEYCINVFCKKMGVDKAEMDKTFKEVARQSERQLGAFLFLYMLVFKRHYPVNYKRVEVRNRIIHQGYIPTPDEVTIFGSMIYDEVYSIVQQVKKECRNEMQAVLVDGLSEKNKKLEPDICGVTSTGASFFSLSHAEQKADFMAALNAHRFQRKVLDLSASKMKAVRDAVNNNDLAKAKELLNSTTELPEIEIPEELKGSKRSDPL